MHFQLNTADKLKITDAELSELLTEVYVDGGFTDADLAKTLFEASAVKQRGSLLGIREKNTDELAGIIIFVPPESKARRLAQANEAEMHLLAVKLKYRGQGLGRQLVKELISIAQSNNLSKIILWTQQTMIAAQKLYESFGFMKIDSFEQNHRQFLVYALDLKNITDFSKTTL